MAKIGLSKPYCALYNNSGQTVTYSEGALIGKAVELSIEVEASDDNILYADNGPAETATTFTGGTFTLTTDDLMPDVMATILGLQKQDITSEKITTASPKWYVWNDKQMTPYMGFGAVVKIQRSGSIKWQAVVLPKIKFSNPSDTFQTQGETIEWGTPEINGTIQRSDAADGPWKLISTPMDSESDAEEAVKLILQITE